MSLVVLRVVLQSQARHSAESCAAKCFAPRGETGEDNDAQSWWLHWHLPRPHQVLQLSVLWSHDDGIT